MNKEVEEIIRLGKDSIVQLALGLIDKGIDVQYFSKIKVMANGEKVYVSFMNPIKHLPMESSFYFDLGVDLLEKTVTYNRVSNGSPAPDKKISFYKPTKETKTALLFVVNTINKSDEVAPVDMANFEGDMTIREHKTYYKIDIVSEFQESFYKIEKTSGKIYDLEHNHLVPPPTFENDNKDPLEEVH